MEVIKSTLTRLGVRGMMRQVIETTRYIVSLACGELFSCFFISIVVMISYAFTFVEIMTPHYPRLQIQ